MPTASRKLFSWPLQFLFWLAITGLLLLFNLQTLTLKESAELAFLSAGFIIAVICGNAYWLIPRWYNRGAYGAYFLFLFLLVAGIARSLAYLAIRAALGWPAPVFFNTFLLAMITGILAAVVGVFFRLSYDYFRIRDDHAALRTANIEAELQLLHRQVQPHFLFNTLNNIYGVVRQSSPEGASLIEKLSAVIRYFQHENQQRQVLLTDEVRFLKSYIELETIRLRYEMPVSFLEEGALEDVLVPPFLLLPLVENIFKHGVDPRSPKNFANLSLMIAGGRLSFTVVNRLEQQRGHRSPGTGLANLKKRLQLYYGAAALIAVKASSDEFRILLSFPI